MSLEGFLSLTMLVLIGLSLYTAVSISHGEGDE